MTRLTIPAFAKINVTLRVLGVRPDGYHELRTVFQSLALRDTIAIERVRGPLRIICTDPSCPADEANLAWRAAAALWRAIGRRGAPRDLRIRITKRIPLQAGLGGGSSDAAATLVALSRLWRRAIARPALRAVAGALGADVPYFLEGGTALGIERGDLLFPLADLPSMWVVLVIPGFGVSTKDAYAWWDASAAVGQAFQARLREPTASRGGAAPERTGLRVGRSADTRVGPYIPMSELRNDLEAPVVAHHPEIGRIAAILRRAGADHAAMSGSGSAVFGLFRSRRDAADAAGRCGTRTRRVILTRTVGRSEYALRGELQTVPELAAGNAHRVN